MQPDTDELVDAAEVARLLGLAHRNSVSTYRARYPDFPRGRPAPGGGRARLWTRVEILAWRERFRGESGDEGTRRERLAELVAATARLMLAAPGTDISIRQIAAEAGVAHSDLYRYAHSKEQLQRLAVDRISNEFAGAFPGDLDTLLASLEPLLVAIRERQAALRVMAHELIVDPLGQPEHEVAIARIPALVRDWRTEHGVHSAVDERVVAAAVGAMSWGLVLFAGRWEDALGLDGIPDDQVAQLLRTLLTS
jgi:glutathione-regulated potassium-efflux system ancillary protein KefG